MIEEKLDTSDEDIIKISKEVIKHLVSFINFAAKNEEKIFIEYQ